MLFTATGHTSSAHVYQCMCLHPIILAAFASALLKDAMLPLECGACVMLMGNALRV